MKLNGQPIEVNSREYIQLLKDLERDEEIYTPIPSIIRLQVTGFTKVPQVVSRESLVSVGREAAEVDAVGVDTAGERRPGETVEVVK